MNVSKPQAMNLIQILKKAWSVPLTLAKHLSLNIIQTNISKHAEYCVCLMHCDIRKLAFHWHMHSNQMLRFRLISTDIIEHIFIFCFPRFNRLKPHVVLDRLVFRKHYGLAIQIAKHLKLPESRILEHWAFHKVTYDKSKSIQFEIKFGFGIIFY